ncbi:MotA/TolQ/ExbB proton channel family protein [Geminicoccaceae bacterium 1502E]|nr:MotA/TolQ/ExbB proton channel family protein [Geminicoccaceae bacterium 1502E]
MEPALDAVLGAPAQDLSLVSLILAADPLVKGVMAILALASVAAWAIIIEKAVAIGRFARQARRLEDIAGGKDLDRVACCGLVAKILSAGHRERDDLPDGGESRGDLRGRIERAMRAVVSARLRELEPGLPFLATVGSAAPFIGLFGTVWGIMNSFTAIAGANDTSLAVVAPGIAEALFATAIGLAAAIPAVIGYNRLAAGMSLAARRCNAAIGEIGSRLSARRREEG